MRTRSTSKKTSSAHHKRKDHSTRTKKPASKIKMSQSTSNRVTRKPKTNFNDLNDDCIEEILRRLPAVELCKFTILNKRLKTIAEEMFKRLYSIKTITFKPTETCATEFGSKITRFVHFSSFLFDWIEFWVNTIFVWNFQTFHGIVWNFYATNSSDWYWYRVRKANGTQNVGIDWSKLWPKFTVHQFSANGFERYNSVTVREDTENCTTNNTWRMPFGKPRCRCLWIIVEKVQRTPCTEYHSM